MNVQFPSNFQIILKLANLRGLWLECSTFSICKYFKKLTIFWNYLKTCRSNISQNISWCLVSINAFWTCHLRIYMKLLTAFTDIKLFQIIIIIETIFKHWRKSREEEKRKGDSQTISLIEKYTEASSNI